ncbi:50S ribosomal protein L22 [Candidatus Parcubacteria bacterium]|nr:MAG: 50S ribosomal protein L22 [Candidatus Parcubacteria bacterium]
MVKQKDKKINKSQKAEKKNFQVKASLRFLRMSPKKVRLVVNMVKNMKVQDALDQLQFLNKAAALPVFKLIKSAIANAENNFGLKGENLAIKNFTVNDGPSLKRWQPKAHGRATPILKRSSHINLVLEDISGETPKKKEIKKPAEKVKVLSPQEVKKEIKKNLKEERIDDKEKQGRGFTKKFFSRKTG